MKKAVVKFQGNGSELQVKKILYVNWNLRAKMAAI